MEAKLQFEKREMEAQKEAQKREMEAQMREMEMRIKLADLAAREALLEMEETESILEQKCESKPFVASHNIVATRSAQPIAANYPPVSKKLMVVNWEILFTSIPNCSYCTICPWP